MICSRCGKETKQFIMRRIRDDDTRVALCPACNRELFPGAAEQAVPREGRAETGRCPACGTTMEEFRRTGLLGCAHCYTAFAAQLLPVIRSVQHAERHNGSTPMGDGENYARVRDLIDRKDSIKERIEQALKAGDYAQVRDLTGSIHEIDAELKQINREVADRRG